MKNHSKYHPWKLIGYKLAYFPILNILYRLPISYEIKLRCKTKLFYDNFARFSRNDLRTTVNEQPNRRIQLYDVGLFKVCIIADSQYFPLSNLEWNLAYEFFDIIYPSLNPHYFRSVMGEGPYETKDVFIERGDHVIDAGANLGIFSFLSSVKTGEKGHVYAIEPIHFFAQCMEESLKANEFKNISDLELALGDENKEEVFFLDRDHPGNSGFNIKTSISFPIRQVTMDSLVFEKKEIPRVDFLKMDIEGSERKALAGAKETIFRFKPKLSLCTYHLKDDPGVLTGIIKKIDPNYKIEMGRKKLYARI